MFIFIQMFFNCTSRERINPFDPNSDVDINRYVSLFIRERQDGFLVEPLIQQPVSFDSIFIYRSLNAPNQYLKILSMPASSDSILDMHPPLLTPLHYSLSLFSDGVETERISPIRRVYGKSNFLVFTTFGYGLYTFSFDFKEEKSQFFFNFPYYYWYPDIQDSIIYLTSRSEDQILMVDWHAKNLLESIHHKNPGPVLATRNNLYVATADSPSVLSIMDKNGSILGQKEFPDFVQELHQTNDQSIIVCGKEHIYILGPAMDVVSTIQLSPGNFLNGQIESSDLYFSVTDSISAKIMRLNLLSGELTTVIPEQAGNSFLVLSDTLYYEEIINQKRNFVKQILNGNRLFSKSVDINITRIKWNPTDRILLLLAQYNGVVIEFSTEGKLLTEQEIPYDPVDIIINEIQSF